MEEDDWGDHGTTVYGGVGGGERTGLQLKDAGGEGAGDGEGILAGLLPRQRAPCRFGCNL